MRSLLSESQKHFQVGDLPEANYQTKRDKYGWWGLVKNPKKPKEPKSQKHFQVGDLPDVTFSLVKNPKKPKEPKSQNNFKLPKDLGKLKELADWQAHLPKAKARPNRTSRLCDYSRGATLGPDTEATREPSAHFFMLAPLAPRMVKTGILTTGRTKPVFESTQFISSEYSALERCL